MISLNSIKIIEGALIRNNRKIKAIIFDIDGVIYDDNKELIDYQKKTAQILGLRIPSDIEIFRLFGKSWTEIIDQLWPGVDSEEYKKAWFKLVGDKLDYLPLNDRVRETLEKLKKKFILGVVSGGHRDWILVRFKNDSLTDFFDVIVSGDDTEKHKPNGEPILYACQKLNIKPEECVYIGDNIIDYEAAKDADVHFIGFIWDGIEHGLFDNIQLNSRVYSFREIPKEIEKIEKNIM